MTLDGAGSALFGLRPRWPAPQITQALTNLLGGFRLAVAPGGPRLLRSPLPVAKRVRSAKAEPENVIDDLSNAAVGPGRFRPDQCSSC